MEDDSKMIHVHWKLQILKVLKKMEEKYVCMLITFNLEYLK